MPVAILSHSQCALIHFDLIMIQTWYYPYLLRQRVVFNLHHSPAAELVLAPVKPCVLSAYLTNPFVRLSHFAYYLFVRGVLTFWHELILQHWRYSFKMINRQLL